MNVVLVFVLLLSACPVSSNLPFESKNGISLNGDFILGGLFYVYNSDGKHGCIDSNPRKRSALKVELMIHTINQINSRSDLLPNVTLGYDIRPYCEDESLAASVALSLIGFHFGNKYRQRVTGQFIGIVGPGASSESVAAALVTTVHQIPVVSYAGSSIELSDKSRFPYFLRTWPPGFLQASAIIDVLLQFNWRYVGLVYSRNTFGIQGAQEIENLADANEICLAYSVPLSEKKHPYEIQDIVDKMLKFQEAKVIIFFIHPSKTGYDLLKALFEVSPDHPGVTLVSSNTFGTVSLLLKHGLVSKTLGSIAIRSYYKEVPGFHDYYRSAQVEGTPMNRWLNRALRNKLLQNSECKNLKDCPDDCNCDCGCDDHYVVDAVYAFAFALDEILKEECGGTLKCLEETATGPGLLPYLRNVSFIGVDGHFAFNKYGDPGAKYRLTIVNDSYDEACLAFWDSRSDRLSQLKMTDENFPWPGNNTSPPRSLCRKICTPGQISIPTDKKCCYKCQKCMLNEIVNNTRCHTCDKFFWPNTNRTICIPIEPSPTVWTSGLNCFILAAALAGLLMTFCVGLGLRYYRNHPLIKATSRELSTVNLLGLLLSCLTVIPILSDPTLTSCAVSDVMIALSLTLTYASTLLKVNRIHRIFQGAKTSKKSPKLVSPRDQIILVLLLISVQLAIIVPGVIVSPSMPRMIQLSVLANQVDSYCRFRACFYASCAYNLLLVLTCCFYALKARKVPSYYNESKFIAASVYSTILLFFAAALVYSTVADVPTKKAAICMVVLLNAYLTLACVYIPKLYAVRFVDELNILAVGSCSSTIMVDEMSRVSVICPVIPRRQAFAACPELPKPSI